MPCAGKTKHCQKIHASRNIGFYLSNTISNNASLTLGFLIKSIDVRLYGFCKRKYNSKLKIKIKIGLIRQNELIVCKSEKTLFFR